MPYANISAEVNKEVSEAIVAKIQEIEEMLPFLIGLTNEERQALPKMSGKTRFFASDALKAAEGTPELLPRYVELDEMHRDLDLFDALSKISHPLDRLNRKLGDTTLAVGSEAYTAALAFYNSAKRAAKDGMPGAQAVVESLSVRFQQATSKKGGAATDSE
jgi:hypothetical protein